LGRTRFNKKLNYAGSLEKRQAILGALARATTGSASSEVPENEPGNEVQGYYTLSLGEMAALVNGDMEKIENWVSRLDRPHATWLLRWIIKER
jgi:hypothetical protein